jgi:predicted Rossmann fold nucleotide-binding protein DprA/Smf involved in DNA uptake
MNLAADLMRRVTPLSEWQPEWQPVRPAPNLRGNQNGFRALVLETMGDAPVRPAELATLIGATSKRVNVELARMSYVGRVKRVRPGLYQRIGVA